MRAAIVGTGPSARASIPSLDGFPYVIGINEAVRYQGCLLTHLALIDEEAIPKVQPFLFRSLHVVASWQVASALLAPGFDASPFMRCRLSVRRAVSNPADPGHIMAGPGGTLVSALWYAAKELDAMEIVIYGCDFHEPGGSTRRNQILEAMATETRRVLGSPPFAEEFANVRLIWKGSGPDAEGRSS